MFVRLGLRSLPVTNTKAYCENSYITYAKSLITLALGVNIIKLLLGKLRMGPIS